MSVLRQEGLRPEEPKTGLSSAAFLAACEGEVTQVWKGSFSGSSHSLGQATSDGWKRLSHLYFWTHRGESWPVLCSFEGPESSEHENILGEGCKLCPPWTHPTLIPVIGARTGPRGLNNKDTKGSTSEKKPSTGGQVKGGSRSPVVCVRGLFDYQIYRGGDRGPGPSATFKEASSCAEEQTDLLSR